ncbi:hypothetical protein Cs7R123_47280 [Catellatospora sp. TT07R-123]|nr:hypothetical protein Cs7R123_47280 [Catellatospora sp. TT07R-123]
MGPSTCVTGPDVPVAISAWLLLVAALLSGIVGLPVWRPFLVVHVPLPGLAREGFRCFGTPEYREAYTSGGRFMFPISGGS